MGAAPAPTLGGRAGAIPRRAALLRTDDGYAVYRVPSGTYTFTYTFTFTNR